MNPDNVLAELERAKRALQAARNLHEDRLYEDAVSRSYYAVMHAAKAALLFHNAIAESHAVLLDASSVPSWFVLDSSKRNGQMCLPGSTAAGSRPITGSALPGNQQSRCVLWKTLARLFSGFGSI